MNMFILFVYMWWIQYKQQSRCSLYLKIMKEKHNVMLLLLCHIYLIFIYLKFVYTYVIYIVSKQIVFI